MAWFGIVCGLDCLVLMNATVGGDGCFIRFAFILGFSFLFEFCYVGLIVT